LKSEILLATHGRMVL